VRPRSHRDADGGDRFDPRCDRISEDPARPMPADRSAEPSGREAAARARVALAGEAERVMRVAAWIVALSFAGSAAAWQLPEVETATLPKEARETLALIRSGGPFPHRKDGSV